MEPTIYKILREAEWQAARREGVCRGSPVDARDGYMHFSARAQLRETLARHYAGERALVVLEVDAARVARDLRWEASRGGALFPHLYASLPMSAVVRALEIDSANDLPREFP